MSERLSSRSLPVEWAPKVDPRELSIGIVHLGLGAFHRAHQAVFTEHAAAITGESRWGISGVSQRSASVREQLAPQDGLYSVLTRGLDSPSVQVIGSMREVLTAPEDPAAVVARIADPAVTLVTLTVTEKGYRAVAGGGLDLADPEIQADLAGRPPRTVVGQLAAGLVRRAETGAGPLTILSCDNLVANGPFLRRLMEDYAAALVSVPEARVEAVSSRQRLAEQLESTRFPAGMVDRIVPATTDADREEAARLLGVRDEALVVAEPFIQWVIEDDFAGARPAWERAGAVLTDDVAPWEQAKLRMLNATHSMLAYLGGLRGYETIAEAVRDAELAELAGELMTRDVVPTLTPPDGLDLTAYGASVLERFANPALKHRTAQVAMDGSVKLPVRLLGTVRDRLEAGAEPRVASLAVAGWMVYVAAGRDVNGRELPLDDPQAARLREAAASAGPGPAGLVDAMLSIESVFDKELAADKLFRSLLIEGVGSLQSH
ncbi:fructuronate reductase [Kribbella voronezhensis]|uniref:Fructuronate reductase n=1 Tax=Kribbella voronezhensis TaxID=2512212 RepID=A0A4R7T5H5_9ACTN|nr:mannitol dehydrogenase family protein [Kribbella voronezhensis]TDU87092.1 fructuronate reductase [Kribbella voronezhensis]